jgi:hypothetical protein
VNAAHAHGTRECHLYRGQKRAWERERERESGLSRRPNNASIVGPSTVRKTAKMRERELSMESILYRRICLCKDTWFGLVESSPTATKSRPSRGDLASKLAALRGRARPEIKISIGWHQEKATENPPPCKQRTMGSDIHSSALYEYFVGPFYISRKSKVSGSSDRGGEG